MKYKRRWAKIHELAYHPSPRTACNRPRFGGSGLSIGKDRIGPAPPAAPVSSGKASFTMVGKIAATSRGKREKPLRIKECTPVPAIAVLPFLHACTRPCGQNNSGTVHRVVYCRVALRICAAIAPILRALDGLVHPSATDDEVVAARHRSFIAAHLLGGLAALAGFPLYLAWSGPTGWIETLIFGFLISPIGIAAYLSRTGRFAVASFTSSACFVGLIALVAGLTGGFASFALVWFAVVPVEAILSGSRRGIAVAVGLVLAAIAGLGVASALGALPPPTLPAGQYALHLASAAVAVITVGVIAFRVVAVHRTGEKVTRRGEARYRLLADNVSDVITQHAANGDLVYVSSAISRVFGLTAGDVLGDGLFARIHVVDRLNYLNAISTAVHRREVTSAEFRIRCDDLDDGDLARNGGPVYKSAEIRCGPFSDASGDGIVAILRDITALKLHEQELEDARQSAEMANDAKTRFLANISHELRTPLNAIIGFSDVLIQDLFGSLPHERHREYANLIHSSGEHLLNVVNGILDISKIEAGNFQVVPEPFEIVPVVESCRQMVAQLAADADITLVADLQQSLPELVADRRACKQILLNLLSNAIKFTDSGGTITIGARREGEKVAFYVTDTGIGIAEADIPKLGTPFVQADSAYDRKYEGTGLGLSVVRGLVDLHDGDLRIASRLGRGTTITVRLPIGGPAPRVCAEAEVKAAEETAPVELAAARKERQLNRA